MANTDKSKAMVVNEKENHIRIKYKDIPLKTASTYECLGNIMTNDGNEDICM